MSGDQSSSFPFGAPSSTPDLGTPSSNPDLGTPSSNPDLGTPSSTPGFGMPSSTPGFGTPSSTRDYGPVFHPSLRPAVVDPSLLARNPAFELPSPPPDLGRVLGTRLSGRHLGKRPSEIGTLSTFRQQQRQMRSFHFQQRQSADAFEFQRPFCMPSFQQPTPFPPLPFSFPYRNIQSTKASISNLTDVSLEITKQLLANEGKEKNMVYSPLSIQVVLWLLTAGSKGPTKEQLLSFLKSESVDELNSLASHLVPLVLADGSSRGGPSLSFANGLWVKESFPIKPSFKEVVDPAYKADIKHVSFQNPEEVRREVNLWAKKATKGLITEALPPQSVDKKTMLIFANALYFKGLWSNKFDTWKTKDDDFHLLNGTSVKVPFMRSFEDQFVKAFDGFKVLKLPYAQGQDKGRQFSMYLLLPNARNGLPGLVERVCSEPGFLDRHHLVPRVEVGDFKIPRFKFTSAFKASDILKDLGLVLPFSAECDLTEMLESSPEDAKIYHKSLIEVDEQGTKAAAVSSYASACASALAREKIDFVADHPFMFLIKEEMTGTVLFIGHVLNPRKE